MTLADPFLPMFGSPIAPWRTCFAWWPVETVDGGWRWLCTVRYRRIAKHSYLEGGGDFWFQYALPPLPQEPEE